MKATLVPISKNSQATEKNWVTRPQMPRAWAEGRMYTGKIRFW